MKKFAVLALLASLFTVSVCEAARVKAKVVVRPRPRPAVIIVR